MAQYITIEIVYALADRQWVEQVELRSPASIADAIAASGFTEQFPEVDLARTPVGIYGTVREPDWLLLDRDRVEIYRPLLLGPTEARRLRALANSNNNSGNKT